MPNASELEGCVLGGCLLDNPLIDELRLLLSCGDFYLDSHRRIYDKMLYLRDKGQPVDLRTLRDVLKKDGDFDRVGGATFISALIDGLPRMDSIEHYAKIIKSKSRARRLIAAANQIIADTFEDPDDSELLSKAEGRINRISADDTDKAEAVPMAEYAEEYVRQADLARERGDRLTGIATDFDGLDLRTLGLQRQELTVIAARVSQGKTTLALNVAQNIVKATDKDYKVLFWSGEMPGARIAGKSIAKEAMIDSFRMRSGEYDEHKVLGALRVFASWNKRFTICDKPHISVSEFRALCRRHKMKFGLDVVVADYLSLFADPPNVQDRRQAVGDNTLMLKNLARELDISVILLHQLSRAPESRSTQDQRPKLSDLAESADVERHSDVVLFLWRDAKPKKGEEGITKCFLAKQRNGPCGEFGLLYVKSQDRLENLADERGLFLNDAPEDN